MAKLQWSMQRILYADIVFSVLVLDFMYRLPYTVFCVLIGAMQAHLV